METFFPFLSTAVAGLLASIISSGPANAADLGGEVATLYAVRDAVREVERPRTIAEAEGAYAREKALGPYQIRPCKVAECNRILGEEEFDHATDARLEAHS